MRSTAYADLVCGDKRTLCESPQTIVEVSSQLSEAGCDLRVAQPSRLRIMICKQRSHHGTRSYFTIFMDTAPFAENVIRCAPMSVYRFAVIV